MLESAIGIAMVFYGSLVHHRLEMGVDKTWGRPWPTLWPIIWPSLWPTGGQLFCKTRLIFAVNLRKQCAPSICYMYDSLLSSWWRFGKVF